MKHIHMLAGRLLLGMTAVFSLFLYSCEDHRVPPTEQNLPDRIFYALDNNNGIHEINIRNTSAPVRSFTVSALQNGEKLLGIDFRPATGQLYAISSQSRIYQVNINTSDKVGLATMIGTGPIATALNGTHIGFDFNPTVDKIRITTDLKQNLRVNPETGAMVTVKDGDLNGPANPRIGAVAYTNSRAGVTAAGAGTTLYDIDPEADMLYIQNPPNDGGLVAVGSIGLNITEVGGFDISPDMNASDVYPIASVKFDNKWELDYVNLSTGKLQKLGDLPSGVDIIGIAIPSMPVAYALEDANTLKIFNPATGTAYGEKVVNIPGVTLLGIDIRPKNGRLYVLGSDSKLYGVDLGSGVATALVSLTNITNGEAVTIDGTIFGVDFNPVADRLRVISNTGQNLRINVETGETNVDGQLKIDGNTATSVVAGAYTNSFPGVVMPNTTLYDIQSSSNMLYTQAPPNDGVLANGKSLGGLDVADMIGFDIGNMSNKGYAILTVGGAAGFYSIDLATGGTTLLFSRPASAKGLALGFGL